MATTATATTDPVKEVPATTGTTSPAITVATAEAADPDKEEPATTSATTATTEMKGSETTDSVTAATMADTTEMAMATKIG